MEPPRGIPAAQDPAHESTRTELTADNVNRELRELYLYLWPKLMDYLPDGQGYSNPLLICVREAYCRAPCRIVVVGQQTDTWFNEFHARSHPDPVGELMRIYDNFDLARPHPGRRNSPYWWASHHINRELNDDSKRCDFVWCDLVRIDQGRARLTQAVEAQVCALDLLRKELVLLAPDVVVLFTGPRYEARLYQTFPGLKLVRASERFEHSMLARAECPTLPRATFRTYHPGYLQRCPGGYDVIRAIAPLVRELGIKS